MSRVIILIILFFVLYVVIKRLIAFSKAPEPETEKDTVKKIVRCARCDTHIPESEATLIDGEFVCKQQPCKQ